MAWVNQDILTISGITATSSGNVVTAFNKTNSPFFVAGAIGVSATEYTAGQTWTIDVYSRIGSGPNFLMAKSGSIEGLSSVFVPILNAETTAQADFMGIPRPLQIDATGSSAGVGITFSAIVSASLLTGD